VEDSVIRPRLALKLDRPLATIAVAKDMFLVIARKRLNQSLATSVDKKGTFLGTALTLTTPAAEEEVMEDQEEAEEAGEGLNATVVAKPVTSHVLVPITRLEVEATVADSLRKLATLAVVLDTCLATVFKARSVTIAMALVIFPVIALSLRKKLAIPAAKKGISRGTAPELTKLLLDCSPD